METALTLTLTEAVQLFSDDAQVEHLFTEARWPDSISCPKCGSLTITIFDAERSPTRYRCHDCKAFFNVKTDSVMHGSQLPLTKWALAIYLILNSNKGVSSVQLAKQLGVTQKTAWYLAHRIRRAFEVEGLFAGPVEVDETYIGGQYKKFKQPTRAQKIARAAKNRKPTKEGKTILLGMVDRASKQVAVRVVPYAASETLKPFVLDHVQDGALVFSDGHGGYKGLPNHTSLQKGLAYFPWQRDVQVHTNHIEGFWAGLKRGIRSTYHSISPKHTERYAREFAARYASRGQPTVEQVQAVVSRLRGRRLRYEDLTAVQESEWESRRRRARERLAETEHALYL